MTALTIVLNYDGAELHTPIWAESETRVDFRNNIFSAERCTAAYAATELRHFLQRCIADIEISFSATIPADNQWISLEYAPDLTPGAFELQPEKNGLRIQGGDRAGLLYGAYEFLRFLGWRWYEPGKIGEIIPPIQDSLKFPENSISAVPAMELRGFDLQFLSKDSMDLLQWMARNRMNMAGCRPLTNPLARKLGMVTRFGGHIFEKMLAPDRVLENGQTVWQTHQDWYGLPASGKKEKATAQQTQFCVAKDDLVAFLAEGLRDKLMHEWYDTDIVNIWGFDTWGQTCQCDDCRKLGNSTDQMLFFLSHLREYLNQSRGKGTLDHDVTLAGCAYEGTATMEGPSKKIPENLVAAGDWVTFYPINRCYAHNLAEPECTRNRYYHDCLTEWFAQENSIKLMLGEYYNVSKFEDLPALFINRQWHDMPTYFQAGASGATYMHIPMVNWGMRRITQLLHAEMSWNPKLDVLAYLTEYWADNYGPYAEKMQNIYRDVEAGHMFISQWRAWERNTINRQMLRWDGAPASETMDPGDHFISVQEMIDDGWESVKLLRGALSELETLRLNERLRVAESHEGQIINAANPLEAERQKLGQPFLKRLDEAWRSLIYGADTMELQVLMLSYHTALSQKELSFADELWGRIEVLAEEMTRYYVPIDYEHPGPGLRSDGALKRTQLDTVIDNCRRYRIQSKKTGGSI